MAWHALIGALVLEHAGLARAEPPGATVPNVPERHFAPTDPACTHYGKCLSGTVPLRAEEDAAKRVRVLCHVLCAQKRRASCIAQHRTWGQHCDRIVFSSDFDDAAIGAVDVKPRWEGAAKKGASRDKWARGWSLVLAHYAEEYDWFVKADDDTLVLVENLRRYAAATASALDPSQPRFLGLRYMQDGIAGRLFNAGAGYVLNRAALKIIGCMLRSNVSTQAPTDERCGVSSSVCNLFTRCTERPLPAPRPAGPSVG